MAITVEDDIRIATPDQADQTFTPTVGGFGDGGAGNGGGDDDDDPSKKKPADLVKAEADDEEIQDRKDRIEAFVQDFIENELNGEGFESNEDYEQLVNFVKGVLELVDNPRAGAQSIQDLLNEADERQARAYKRIIDHIALSKNTDDPVLAETLEEIKDDLIYIKSVTDLAVAEIERDVTIRVEELDAKAAVDKAHERVAEARTARLKAEGANEQRGVNLIINAVAARLAERKGLSGLNQKGYQFAQMALMMVLAGGAISAEVIVAANVAPEHLEGLIAEAQADIPADAPVISAETVAPENQGFFSGVEAMLDFSQHPAAAFIARVGTAGMATLLAHKLKRQGVPNKFLEPLALLIVSTTMIDIMSNVMETNAEQQQIRDVRALELEQEDLSRRIEEVAGQRDAAQAQVAEASAWQVDGRPDNDAIADAQAARAGAELTSASERLADLNAERDALANRLTEALGQDPEAQNAITRALGVDPMDLVSAASFGSVALGAALIAGMSAGQAFDHFRNILGAREKATTEDIQEGVIGKGLLSAEQMKTLNTPSGLRAYAIYVAEQLIDELERKENKTPHEVERLEAIKAGCYALSGNDGEEAVMRALDTFRPLLPNDMLAAFRKKEDLSRFGGPADDWADDRPARAGQTYRFSDDKGRWKDRRKLKAE